jgi:hypothetical protein
MDMHSKPKIAGAKRLMLPLIPPDLSNKGGEIDKERVGQSLAIVMPVT